MTEIELVIIGGGVVGLAVARAAAGAGHECAVIEKNPKFTAENQSSRNSGVIHAGIYYDPALQPRKARLCVEGNRQLYAFCRESGVPAHACGKLVVAARTAELEYLQDTARIARENGVPFEEWDTGRLRRNEPALAGQDALHFPTSGIVEATSLVRALAHRAEESGAFLLPGTRVRSLSPDGDGFVLTTESSGTDEIFRARRLVNAAGLESDRIARMVNPDFPWQLEPVRGESAAFVRGRRPELAVGPRNIYPAPYAYWNDTGEPADVDLAAMRRLLTEKRVTRTVGVHLTPCFELDGEEFRIGRTMTIGPEKTPGRDRDDLAGGLKPPALYLQRVRPFFPGLRVEDIKLYQAGIAASLPGAADWVIERDARCPSCIQLVGIDSPGLTACLAIADEVVRLLEECLPDR